MSGVPVSDDAAAPPPGSQRRDQVRNRSAVLRAAAMLFDRDGASATSMDAIAAEAGVGKGTLFLHFHDRPSLIAAVLHEPEQAFQEAFIRGRPPLGPGARADRRLAAFGQRRLEFLEAHADLLADAEGFAGAARFQSPVRRANRAHLVMLLRDAGTSLDVELAAEMLLDELGAQLFLFRRREQRRSLLALKRHWAATLRHMLG